MALQSVPDLIQALRASAILSRGQADELARTPSGRFADARALARDLLGRNWVTPYQINQLFLGRGHDLILGPYVLLERLGEGGMGQVFKARHRKLNRVVALKVIRRDKLDHPEAIRRFYREIQAAAALSHSNIVAAYDADEVNGAYYFAMEYVEGRDLGKIVKQDGPLPVAQACDYVRQVALGLQHAFEKGLVHRDIKPSNLVVQTSGSQAEAGPLVKILDMGLALVANPVADESSDPLTQAHAVLGTPDFIAPEQARSSRDADIRSDLYSLGCTFYFVLAGQPPYAAETPMEKLLKHYLEEPPYLEVVRPEVPAVVAQVVRKLMAKSPDQRYQTPGELAEALGALLVAGIRTPVSVPLAVPVGPPSPPEEAPARTPDPTDEAVSIEDTLADGMLQFEATDAIIKKVRARTGVRRRQRRRGLMTYAIAGVALGLLAVFIFVLLRYVLS